MLFAAVENNFLVFITTVSLLGALGGYSVGNKVVGLICLIAFIICVILCVQFDTVK